MLLLLGPRGLVITEFCLELRSKAIPFQLLVAIIIDPYPRGNVHLHPYNHPHVCPFQSLPDPLVAIVMTSLGLLLQLLLLCLMCYMEHSSVWKM